MRIFKTLLIVSAARSATDDATTFSGLMLDNKFSRSASQSLCFRQRQNMTPLEYRGVHNRPASTVAGRRTASAEGNEE